MATPDKKQLVVDELQKTINWLVDQQAESRLIAAVVHTLQLTLERFVKEEAEEQFYNSLVAELAKNQKK